MKTPHREIPPTSTDVLEDVKIGECFYPEHDTHLWYRANQEHYYTRRSEEENIDETKYLCVRLEDGYIDYLDRGLFVRPVEHEAIERLATDS